ncbi:glycosyltransferase like family 2-domain-containing protein [Xylariaceae sp. FL1019]|nr:glycosyltransferase like family 2-domain-containing protein [Xylariaceae sp. FL1019]
MAFSTSHFACLVNRFIGTPSTSKRGLSEAEWHRVRTERIVQVMQYSWLILPVISVVMLSILQKFFLRNPSSWVFTEIDDTAIVNWYLIRWLICVAPTRPLRFTGFLFMFWPTNPFWIQQQPTKRSFTRLLICIVTKGDNVAIVNQSVRAAQDLCSSIDPRISLHVLTEEVNVNRFNNLRSDVFVHGCPKAFHAQKAKYKARSLEWFRIAMRIEDDDWILHIDEETSIDEYLVKRCIDFITRQADKDIATGVIHYNLPGYFRNPVTAIADLTRIFDDWIRIPVLAKLLNHVALGVHGGFLLIRGAVENDVTWDTGSLTEDYWFTLRAAGEGHRFGWVPAIAREVSAENVSDFARQRRRWFSGMRNSGSFPGLMETISCAWQVFEPSFWILNLLYPVPAPRWFFNFLCFETATTLAIMPLALVLQNIDAGLPIWKTVYLYVVCLLVTPISAVVVSWAAVGALFWPTRDWHVITKNAAPAVSTS